MVKMQLRNHKEQMVDMEAMVVLNKVLFLFKKKKSCWKRLEWRLNYCLIDLR